MARVLILGGGCRGRRLAQLLVAQEGHAVRIVTRTEAGRPAIEATGAECLIGDPGRLGTLRGALDGVSVACWLLATAREGAEQVQALHDERLRAFLGQAIDSTMRGFVYEAPVVGATAVGTPTVAGQRIVTELAARNAIPLAFVHANPGQPDPWLAEALGAIGSLLGG